MKIANIEHLNHREMKKTLFSLLDIENGKNEHFRFPF